MTKDNEMPDVIWALIETDINEVVLEKFTVSLDKTDHRFTRYIKAPKAVDVYCKCGDTFTEDAICVNCQAIDDLNAKGLIGGLPHIEGLEDALILLDESTNRMHFAQLSVDFIKKHKEHPNKFIQKAAKAYAANMKEKTDDT